MPSPSHLLLNFPELRPHAVASGFPFDLELTPAACSANEGKAKKIEGFRFSEPALSASLHSEAAELDQAVFSGWSDSENARSRSRIHPRSAGRHSRAQTNDEVIGISHESWCPWPHDVAIARPRDKHVVQVILQGAVRSPPTLPVPPSLTVTTTPVFRTPALSHFLDRRSMRRS